MRLGLSSCLPAHSYDTCDQRKVPVVAVWSMAQLQGRGGTAGSRGSQCHTSIPYSFAVCPEHLAQEVARRYPSQMPLPPQLVQFNVEE